jgi:hypothetical protein
VTTTAVVVPFHNPGGCPWRAAALGHVLTHYSTHHPGWEVVLGAPPGPVWSKGAAVAAAAAGTTADLLVVADGDVWVSPAALVEATAGAAGGGWAVPHSYVHRLDRDATTRVYTTPGGSGDRPPAGARLARAPYRGVPGGGITVITRGLYRHCPLDPRFLGWGGEDVAWGWALNRVAGPPWRGPAPLWHLWHPTSRVGHVGSPESAALLVRWRKATTHPRHLQGMLTELREAACGKP